MALLGPRNITETDISLTCATASERGYVVVYKTAGSGDQLGDHAGITEVITAQSGKKPAGVLMCDVVSYDTTKYHGNFHKDEVLINERVALLKKGRITTNALVSGQTPTHGDKAYLGASGKFTATYVNDAATPIVGEFVGAKDENGYVTVDVNLPMSK